MRKDIFFSDILIIYWVHSVDSSRCFFRNVLMLKLLLSHELQIDVGEGA